MKVEDAFGSEVDLSPGDEILYGNFSRPRLAKVISVMTVETSRSHSTIRRQVVRCTEVTTPVQSWRRKDFVVRNFVKTGVNYFKGSQELIDEGNNLAGS